MGSQATFHEFNKVYSKDQMYTWQTTPAPDGTSATQALVVAPSRLCNPVLAPGERFWRPFPFCNTKTTKNHKRGKVWSNTVNWTISNNFFEFLSYKNGNGRQNLSLYDKTAPRVPKVGFKGGRVQQLSARVTLVPSEAGMVSHIREHTKKCPLNGSVPLSPNFFFRMFWNERICKKYYVKFLEGYL